MDEVIIDEVYPLDESSPVIFNFQNGYPRETFGEHKCAVLEHKITGKKTYATEINHYLYTGEEKEVRDKTMLLARNKTTGKVRLIEVRTVDLKPVIKSELDTSVMENSFAELGRKFGSKKYKKALEQSEKLKVNKELVAEQLKNVSHNVSVDQLDTSSSNRTESEDFYLPPVNREATNIDDVYKLHAILSKDEFETIYSDISDKLFVKDLFPCISEIYTEKWTNEQLVLALYASSLLKMNNLLMSELKKKAYVACPESPTLNSIILKEFFVYKQNVRTRPAQYKDKALCHAIIFIFLINRYKLDIESLCKHCKQVEKTAILKINMTGAYSSKQGTTKVAVLKLPLNKATANFGRRRSVKF